MRPILEAVAAPDVEPGTRAFIIGNGKSLAPDQLDKLQEEGEVTFGVNRIHFIYDETSWRPTYWVTTDLDGTKAYVHDIPLHAKQNYPCYVRCDIMARCVVTWLGAIPNEDVCKMLESIHPLDAVNHIQIEERIARDPWVDGKYNEGGSVACAQQLALAWGYNPVYMIGCEGDIAAGKKNHFYDEDFDDRRSPDRIEAINELMQIVDEIALREYRARGAEIYNATVGGSKRNAIPMTDFWGLF